jgi:large subunit ribosomal protein L6
MSKIGRKPIDIGSAQVEINGQEVKFSGKKGSGLYILPEGLNARIDGKLLYLSFDDKSARSDANRIWGLHRALLSNEIKGCEKEFEKNVQINGLGFKAAVTGSNVIFSLGYSHKIPFTLPKEVTLETDKTGQKLVFRSSNKELLGQVCSVIRSFRPPEPYKGTGIKFDTEVITRKAGKTKAA